MGDSFFNVRAKHWQAPTWRRVARYRGFHSVGAWLATIASDAAALHAEAAAAWAKAEREKLPPRLPWRPGRFGVNLWRETRFVEVEHEGLVSPPFGIYSWLGGYSLAHTPTGHSLINLRRRRDCQTVAAELALCTANWHETDGERVLVGPGREEVRAVLDRWRRIADKT